MSAENHRSAGEPDAGSNRSEAMDILRDWMQTHRIDVVQVTYHGAGGVTYYGAGGRGDREIEFVLSADAPLNVRNAMAAGTMGRLQLPDDVPYEDVQELVYDCLVEVIQQAGHSSWAQEAGGGGTADFRADGGCKLHHYDTYEYDVEADYLIEADGSLAIIGGTRSLEGLQDELASAMAALTDALTALRDRDAGFPVDELLRKHKVELKLEPLASAPAPGM